MLAAHILRSVYFSNGVNECRTYVSDAYIPFYSNKSSFKVMLFARFLCVRFAQ